MSNYTRKDYEIDCIKLRDGMTGKRSIDYILKNYFAKLNGDGKKDMRIVLVNALNGNSYSKAIEHNLMPIFKEVYKIKTGTDFN